MLQDETFPELQAANGEGEGGAGDERPGSGDADDRGGAAFPKAFERDLVTPTALQVIIQFIFYAFIRGGCRLK
jgi:hypothetical protein